MSYQRQAERDKRSNGGGCDLGQGMRQGGGHYAKPGCLDEAMKQPGMSKKAGMPKSPAARMKQGAMKGKNG